MNPRQPRHELVAATVVTVGLVVFLWSGAGGEDAATRIVDVGSFVAALGAMIACGRAARREKPNHSAWVLLTVTTGLLALGELLWSYFEIVRGDVVPFPSIADAAYLASVPTALTALLLFSRNANRASLLRMTLDGAVIAGAMLFVVWVGVLDTIWNDHTGTLLARTVSITYPVSDIAMATVAILVLHWGNARDRRTLHLLAAGFVLMSVADSGFSYLTDNGSYSSANAIGALWIGAYLAIMLAARSPREARDAIEQQVEPIGVTMLPYAPLSIALAVAIAGVAGGKPLDGFAAATALGLIIAVSVRQAVTALDNRNLAQRLDRSLAEVRRREEQLARLALHDSLTGLANRAMLYDTFAAMEPSPTPAAIMYIDLDGFKSVNDRLGHATGDRALILAARRLTNCIEPGMLLARLGGDEFVILVPEGIDAARRTADRVMEAFSHRFELMGERAQIGASAGIAVVSTPADPDETLRRADAAMYAAKRAGKARTMTYPDGTDAVGASV